LTSGIGIKILYLRGALKSLLVAFNSRCSRAISAWSSLKLAGKIFRIVTAKTVHVSGKAPGQRDSLA